MDMLIDGVRLKDIGIRVKEDSLYLGIPATRDETVTVPGRHGAYDMDSWIEPKPFNLNCRISSKTETRELVDIIKKLSELLLDAYGKPKKVMLIMEHEPDKHYKVKYAGNMPLRKIAKIGDFAIPLTAYDPFAYFNYPANEICWDTDIPILSDISWGTGINKHEIKNNQTLEIINDGNLVVRPTFIIEGSANLLTLAMNGESFYLESFTDATYEIKGENYTVLKNGANNFDDKKGNAWLELMPGVNVLTITGTGLNINLTIDYRYKYTV